MPEQPRPVSLGGEPEGRYANYFKAGHNAFEVILEFAQFYESDSQPRVHTRIITSPAYARTFMEVLKDSLDRYEKVYGPIASGRPHE
jgi:Protein of unknown function (DUF3467)